MIYQSSAKTLYFALFSILLTFSHCDNTYAAHKGFHYRHFYFGGTIAYGQTTWAELASDDIRVQLSTPASAEDFGSTWGGFIGYQFAKSFTLESSYMRYPNSRIKFSALNFYPPYPNSPPLREIVSRTQAFALSGKFLLPLANGRVSAFAAAGVGFTHRSDPLAKVTRVAPTFGLGFMGNVSERVITELGFEYYIGYGRSEFLPVNDYVPFLFSVYFRLGYRLF